ncbi:MAG TPA: DUF2846 domain-containing protein [Phycisphaerales bacterium]|nr:DUF2846 domain-containing protein [Phycisphaerales bacterium]
MPAKHARLGLLLLLGLAVSAALAACSSPLRTAFRPEFVGADGAVVYVYRPRAPLSRRPAEVYIDQRHAGTLAQGEYLPLHVNPGEHHIRVEARASAARRVEVRPGESAYLHLIVRRMGRRVALEEADPDAALERLAHSSLAQP